MTDLFFRNGERYKGGTPHTFKPIKGEARVVVYDDCPKCKRVGRVGLAPYDVQCSRCHGSGRAWHPRNVTVYTKMRLDDLNARRRKSSRKRSPESVIALRAVKAEWRAFLRQRDALVTSIITYSALSPTLQGYRAKIEAGLVLSPREIRNAQLLCDSLSEYR